jgi:hypothetical protein
MMYLLILQPGLMSEVAGIGKIRFRGGQRAILFSLYFSVVFFVSTLGFYSIFFFIIIFYTNL